jgi:hypothetical protein
LPVEKDTAAETIGSKETIKTVREALDDAQKFIQDHTKKDQQLHISEKDLETDQGKNLLERLNNAKIAMSKSFEQFSEWTKDDLEDLDKVNKGLNVCIDQIEESLKGQRVGKELKRPSKGTIEALKLQVEAATLQAKSFGEQLQIAKDAGFCTEASDDDFEDTVKDMEIRLRVVSDKLESDFEGSWMIVENRDTKQKQLLILLGDGLDIQKYELKLTSTETPETVSAEQIGGKAKEIEGEEDKDNLKGLSLIDVMEKIFEALNAHHDTGSISMAFQKLADAEKLAAENQQ